MNIRITIFYLLLCTTFLFSGEVEQVYKDIDQHALSTPKSVTGSIESLVKYLIEPTKNDLEKVRIIYRWVTNNIRYDSNAYFSGRYPSQDASYVLKTKKSVCSGYSNLFEALCLEAGIEVVTISGYAKGYSYKPGRSFNKTNHAWNVVNLDNKWFIIDSTWGAGYMNGKKFVKEFEEFWFLTDPNKSIFSHLPEDPKWQLLTDPISKKTFQKSPNLKGNFFDLGFIINDVNSYINGDKYRGFPKIYAFDADAKVIEGPISKYLSTKETYIFSLKVEGANSVVIINNGKWISLKQNSDTWSYTLTPKKGSLTVGYSKDGRSSRHSYMLKYIVQ
ncbi:MAG: hypothetical protein OCD02_21750 [Spirochaetaceae bacterium]